MTRAEIERRLLHHHECFLRRDPPALAANHSADGTFESPATGLVRGRAAIEAVYSSWFKGFPDLLLSWEDEVIEGDRAVFFWTLTGTASGPFYGIVGSGTQVKANGAGDYRFGPDGIESALHVFDWTAVLVATGVLKAKPA
jgi:predicted ester cyclase